MKRKRKKNFRNSDWFQNQHFERNVSRLRIDIVERYDRRMVKRVHIFLHNFISALNNNCIHLNLSSIPNRRIRIVANLKKKKRTNLQDNEKKRVRFLNGREIEIFHFSYFIQFIAKSDK